MGREAGFVFKSEDLCFVSRELCCSCLGFCVLFKQLWGLKPLSARGMVSLKAAPRRGCPAAGSKAACWAACPLPGFPAPHLHPQWSLFLIWHQQHHYWSLPCPSHSVLTITRGGSMDAPRLLQFSKWTVCPALFFRKPKQFPAWVYHCQCPVFLEKPSVI